MTKGSIPQMNAAAQQVVPIRRPPKGIETPPPADPLGVARKLAAFFWTDSDHTGLPTLRRWRDQFWLWSRDLGRWRALSEEELRTEVYRMLSGMDSTHGPCAYWAGMPPVCVTWSPNKGQVGAIADALMAVTATDATVEPGDWLDGSSHASAIACRGSWVRHDPINPYSETGEPWRPADATPAWFNPSALSVPYDPHAPEPKEWLEFLDQIFDGDAAAIALLRQWFGYLLSGKTDLHKAMQLLGPTRSGKGTIARVLEALYGTGVAHTSLSALAGGFGLQSVMTAPVVLIGDAKSDKGGANGADPIERLLGIIGGDPVPVNRKYLAERSVKLPGRFMILSNDVLPIADNAGALSARFLFLQTKVSFLGREDFDLAGRLTAERSLQGIVSWALGGLEELERSGGQFVVQPAAQVRAEEFRALGQPLGEFFEECLIEAAGTSIEFDGVYCIYRDWCESQKLKISPKATLRSQMNGWKAGLVTRPRVTETETGLAKTETAEAWSRPWVVNGYSGVKFRGEGAL